MKDRCSGLKELLLPMKPRSDTVTLSNSCLKFLSKTNLISGLCLAYEDRRLPEHLLWEASESDYSRACAGLFLEEAVYRT